MAVGSETDGGFHGNFLSVFCPVEELKLAKRSSCQDNGVTIVVSTCTRDGSAFCRIGYCCDVQLLDDEVGHQVAVGLGNEGQRVTR